MTTGKSEVAKADNSLKSFNAYHVTAIFYVQLSAQYHLMLTVRDAKVLSVRVRFGERGLVLCDFFVDWLTKSIGERERE
jgi:hypothetical protein